MFDYYINIIYDKQRQIILWISLGIKVIKMLTFTIDECVVNKTINQLHTRRKESIKNI